jgi:peptide/nickel transport system permease protein/oligopeptide transport system permease protein
VSAARYTARRLVELLVVFLGVTLLIYLAVFALPGDPIAALGGDRPLPAGVQAALRARYHLDEPVLQQYVRYLGGLLHGDLGENFAGQSVAAKMAVRWPTTIALALTAWGMEIVAGVGLGLYAGLRPGRLGDRFVLAGTILATSIPVFVLAVSAQLVVGLNLGWLPVAGDDAGWPTAYLMPGAVIAVFGLASVARLMRGSVIETMRSDHVRALWAKGLTSRQVIGVHVLRSSAIPVTTFLAIDLGYLLGGTVVVEGVFNLPGVGNLLFQAIRAHEGPTVVGVATSLIIVFLVVNVLVDLLHSLLDPRIRHV